MERYQMVLAPCPATRKESWGYVVGSGKSILALWDTVGWRGNGYAWDQAMTVKDTKTGKEMSETEYAALVKKLKGWE